MGPQCFREKDSNPSACGVHNVALVQSTIPIDENAPYLGQVTCWICPVGGTVLQDSEGLDPKVPMQ